MLPQPVIKAKIRICFTKIWAPYLLDIKREKKE